MGKSGVGEANGRQAFFPVDNRMEKFYTKLSIVVMSVKLRSRSFSIFLGEVLQYLMERGGERQ